MNNFELQDLATHFNLEAISLDRDTPFSFILADKYHLTIELNDNDCVVISLKVPLEQYENDKFVSYLKQSSFLDKRLINFSLGYAKDHLYLMTMLDGDAKASDVENALISLVNQYEELERTL